MNIRPAEGFLIALAMLALAIGVPLALILAGVSKLSWIAIGAALWAGSDVFKIVAGLLINFSFSEKGRATKGFAALWGAWSALCELGAVAAFFLIASRPATVGNVIGLGIGAGSIEVTFVCFTPLQSRAVPSEMPSDWLLRWSGVVERSITLVGHTASRGLVWAAFVSPVWWPAPLFGFATFALVDGVAVYGSAQKWKWADPRLLRRWLSFMGLLGLIEAAAFAAVLMLGA